MQGKDDLRLPSMRILAHDRGPMRNLPTAFQRSILWTAVSALSLALIGALSVGLIWLAARVIGFLQPILVPFAVAAVLAYLIEPGVVWLEKRGMTRQRSVMLLFVVLSLFLAGLAWWMVPKVGEQVGRLARRLPAYSQKAQSAALQWAQKLESEYGINLLLHASPAGANASAQGQESAPGLGAVTSPLASKADVPGPGATAASAWELDLKAILSGEWVRTTLPGLLRSALQFVGSGIGGFLGISGFVLSLVIVPLYLYYFLMESAKIKAQWSDYLPLRASAFKDEVVSCLSEINGYLVAFFRGQLFVSVVNGAATGLGLAIVGLDFGLLIGLALCVLGIIPYLGIALCWIPAVAIAALQGGSALIPADPWWALPAAVSAVFLVVQQVDGIFITPKVVGDAVGLHPMTVMASVFLWGLLLGGLLGAILAVPLTASVKVLFQRYIWRARIAPQTLGGAKSVEGSGEFSGAELP
jgi:predicted PurR-regulated permease PerM